MTSPFDEVFPIPQTPITDEEELLLDGELVPVAEFLSPSRRDGSDKERAAALLYGVLMRLEAEKAATVAKYASIKAMIADEEEYLDKQIERCKRFFRIVVPPESGGLTNETVDISYRATIETKIDVEDMIPLEFCEVRTVPNKRAIKEALEKGEEVPGAYLARNFHIQCKPGGKKAIANAKKRKTLHLTAE